MHLNKVFTVFIFFHLKNAVLAHVENLFEFLDWK